MTELQLTAPAKINLWLEIRSRRPDGYHDIESVMQTVSLCDTLTLKKADGIAITCSNDTLDCGETNLCHKAARAFFAASGIDGGAAIHIDKHIPIAGGLAGGSTDAAATLRGLNLLYETGYSVEKLCAIGVKIGADVPFCVKRGIAVTRGIGDRFSEAPRLPDCHIVVACAGEGVSTPWAYGRLDEMYDFAARTVNADDFTRVIAGGRLGDITAAMTNIFESAVLPVRPQAVSIKENLLKSGALGALMSGSGPSVFGIFDNPESADLAVRQLTSLGIAAQCCIPYYPGEN